MSIGQGTATRHVQSRIKAARFIVRYIRRIAAEIETETDAADAFLKIGRRDLSDQCLAHVTRLVSEAAA